MDFQKLKFHASYWVMHCCNISSYFVKTFPLFILLFMVLYIIHTYLLVCYTLFLCVYLFPSIPVNSVDIQCFKSYIKVQNEAIICTYNHLSYALWLFGY